MNNDIQNLEAKIIVSEAIIDAIKEENTRNRKRLEKQRAELIMQKKLLEELKYQNGVSVTR
jgi:uncharacterized coiled-coil protein SlyX